MQYSKFSKAKYKIKKWKMGEGERIEEDEATKPDFFRKKQEGMQEKMNTKSFFRKEIFLTKETNTKGKLVMDKRAVSPVIGVILMVAITVIIAAVIAAFVFGITPTTEKAPNVQLVVTGSDATEKLTLKHKGGDPVNLSQCIVYVGGDTDNPLTMTPGLITVGFSSTSDAVTGGLTEGNAVSVEVIHVDSQSYILDTVITVGP